MMLPAFTADRQRLQHGARSYRSTYAADAGAQQQTRQPRCILKCGRPAMHIAAAGLDLKCRIMQK